MTAEKKEHIKAVRDAYFKNMTPERRARHQAKQLQYLKNRPHHKIEERMEYQRQAMRRRRKDPGYMAKFKAWFSEWRTSAKEHCINMYSNGEACCAICKNADIDVLCLDHIENNGKAHRAMITGASTGTMFYSRLRTLGYPPGLQVLCANCNLKKEILRRRGIPIATAGRRVNGY